MKRNLFIIPVIGLLVAAIGCGPTQTETIGRNVDPDVTNLEGVTTYNWTQDIDDIPDARVFISPTGVYVFNNESTRNRIKEAIEYEFDTRGYKPNSNGSNAHSMLVSFFVLERRDTLQRTGDYITIFGESVVQEGEEERTPVEPGTLIINIVDNKSDKMVWQGFASGILKPEDVNDEAKIRQAVSSIFERFPYSAKNGS